MNVNGVPTSADSILVQWQVWASFLIFESCQFEILDGPIYFMASLKPKFFL